MDSLPDMAPLSQGNEPTVSEGPKNRPRWAWVLGWFVGLFGVISVFSGGAVLFVGGPVSVHAGNAVPFVVWFNFLAGFAYLAAAVGLLRWRPWITPLATAIAGMTIFVFAAFGIHTLSGEAFEARTVGAMAFRSALWVGLALALRRSSAFASSPRP